MKTRTLLLAAALAAGGCEPSMPVGTICTAIAVDALTVTVIDRATGARLCDATVVATDGAFREPLRPHGAGTCTYSGPTERPGRYDVEASAPGYTPAVQRDVRVTADECHVIPMALTILLDPMP
jgi:hypothetical protein